MPLPAPLPEVAPPPGPDHHHVPPRPAPCCCCCCCPLAAAAAITIQLLAAAVAFPLRLGAAVVHYVSLDLHANIIPRVTPWIAPFSCPQSFHSSPPPPAPLPLSLSPEHQLWPLGGDWATGGDMGTGDTPASWKAGPPLLEREQGEVGVAEYSRAGRTPWQRHSHQLSLVYPVGCSDIPLQEN